MKLIHLFQLVVSVGVFAYLLLIVFASFSNVVMPIGPAIILMITFQAIAVLINFVLFSGRHS